MNEMDPYETLLRETEEALRAAQKEKEHLQMENERLRKEIESLNTEKESWRFRYEDLYNSRGYGLVLRAKALLGRR